MSKQTDSVSGAASDQLTTNKPDAYYEPNSFDGPKENKTLTERERQIMMLVVIGRANKQIAAELTLSEMTVKVHRGQVMRKMHAGSLPELVRMADRLGEPIATS